MRAWVGIVVVATIAAFIGAHNYQKPTPDTNARMRAFITTIETRAASNPRDAYAYLKNAVRTDDTAAYLAHYTGHIVGGALYDMYGMDGMSTCDDDLLYACFHGFMLRALDQGEDPLAVVQSCKEYGSQQTSQEKQAYAYLVGCVHGLGHSFFTMVDDELAPALKACEEFIDTDVVLYDEFKKPMLDGVLSCKEGVFMQRAETARPVRDAFAHDPWSFCSFPNAQDRIACARYQGLLAHRLLTPTATTIVSICESAPDEDMKNNCYHEAGFTESLVFEEKQLSVPNVIAACAAIERPYGVYRCTAVAAATYVLEQFPNWKEAAHALCASLNEGSQACFARVALMTAYISEY